MVMVHTASTQFTVGWVGRATIFDGSGKGRHLISIIARVSGGSDTTKGARNGPACLAVYAGIAGAGQPVGGAQNAADEWHLVAGASSVAEVTGDGPLELRPGLVQGAKAGLERQDFVDVAVEAEVFLLLESSEVVLDEEGGVEFANSHLLF